MYEFRKRIKEWFYGSCLGFAGSFPYFGSKIYFPKNSLIFKLACKQGIYEIENFRLLSALVAPNSLYFDVGANIGLMAVPILYSCHSCKVISLEPSPVTLQFLCRTAQESQYQERWKIVGKAAGKQVGTLEFFTAATELGAYDGFKDTERGGETQKITVPVTTIDQEWIELGKPTVSVIKIDVEGGELDALQGAFYCIKHERPYILLEWNSVNLKAYGYQSEDILDFAESHNYQIVSVPDFAPVNHPETLKLHMIRTESFLLFPIN
jgi:FkbM family methyltransferase